MTLRTNLKFLFPSLIIQRTCSLCPRFHDRLSTLILFTKKIRTLANNNELKMAYYILNSIPFLKK